MSTTPVTPVSSATTTTTATAPVAAKPVTTAVPATIVASVEKDITWIRGHVLAVLLAIALIAGSIIGGMTLFENLIEKHDARVAATQLAKEKVDTATQAALMNQLTQAQAANASRDAAQAALIQSLISQMSQQHAATAKQVSTDSTLDAQAAASRLMTQTNSDPSAVTASNDGVTMNLPLTRTIVSDLDQFSQAQKDVTNLQGQLSAQQIVTSDTKTELSTADKVIAADKTELIATVKADNDACNVRVDQQIQKDRKKSFWSAAGGFISGLILGSRI